MHLVFQAPAQQRVADMHAGLADRRKLGLELPADPLILGDAPQPGDEHRDVVALGVGVHPVERGLAQVFERRFVRVGTNAPFSRSRPSEMSLSLLSTSPSVYSTNRLPSSTLNRCVSMSPSPTPSGGDGVTVSSSLRPSG